MVTSLSQPNFPFRAWTIVHGHQIIQLIRIGSKNSCKYGLMSSVYTPILVGVVSSLSEILLPSKMAKFSFRGMDYYSPWSSKNSIDRNWLKKFMQVGTPILVGVVSPLLEILLPSKTAKFPFWGMDYSPWSSMMSKCMCTQFWGAWSFRFWRYCHLKKQPNFPFGAWTIVHGHQKI